MPHVILPNTYGHLTGILRNTNEVTKVDHCFYLCFFTSKVMRICRLLEQSRDSDDDDDNDDSMLFHVRGKHATPHGRIPPMHG